MVRFIEKEKNLMISDSSQKSGFKKILEWIDEHHGMVIALATCVSIIVTIVLVVITSLHIGEARKMRIETKRMIDVSIDQFKIKSYPSIAIESMMTISEDPPKDRIHLRNIGEITAYQVNTLIVYHYSRDGIDKYTTPLSAVYKDETGREISSIDIDFDLTPGPTTIINSDRGQKNFEYLKHLLILVRFKVPYDAKYRYKSRVYIKNEQSVENQVASYIWNYMATDNQEQIIQDTVNFLRNYSTDNPQFMKMKRFLKDYGTSGGQAGN